MPTSNVVYYAQLTDNQTFWIAFCICFASLLALLVLATDKNGNLKVK